MMAVLLLLLLLVGNQPAAQLQLLSLAAELRLLSSAADVPCHGPLVGANGANRADIVFVFVRSVERTSGLHLWAWWYGSSPAVGAATTYYHLLLLLLSATDLPQLHIQCCVQHHGHLCRHCCCGPLPWSCLSSQSKWSSDCLVERGTQIINYRFFETYSLLHPALLRPARPPLPLPLPPLRPLAIVLL
jgi:hypothetical protein